MSTGRLVDNHNTKELDLWHSCLKEINDMVSKVILTMTLFPIMQQSVLTVALVPTVTFSAMTKIPIVATV